jgi:hypothetical protein
MTARFRDGEVRFYGHPDDDPQEKKLWECTDSVRTGEPVACVPEAAFSQVLCVNGMQESMPEIVVFPDRLIRMTSEPDDRRIRVEGLEKVMIGCFAQNAMPSEMGVPWSRRGTTVDLNGYDFFPRRIH